MFLKEWLDLQPENMKLLQQSINKAPSTIKSYSYGYRKIPTKLIQKIIGVTKGLVSSEELKSVYENYCNERKQFALVRINKNRRSKPLITVDTNACEVTKNDFSISILKIISNDLNHE